MSLHNKIFSFSKERKTSPFVCIPVRGYFGDSLKPYTRAPATVTKYQKRAQAARDNPNKRFANGKSADIVCNADMRVGEIKQFCQMQAEGQNLMRSAMSQLQLSACVYAEHNVIVF